MKTKVKMMEVSDVIRNCERAATEGWMVRQIAIATGGALVVFEKADDTHEGIKR